MVSLSASALALPNARRHVDVNHIPIFLPINSRLLRIFHGRPPLQTYAALPCTLVEAGTPLYGQYTDPIGVMGPILSHDRSILLSVHNHSRVLALHCVVVCGIARVVSGVIDRFYTTCPTRVQQQDSRGDITGRTLSIGINGLAYIHVFYAATLIIPYNWYFNADCCNAQRWRLVNALERRPLVARAVAMVHDTHPRTIGRLLR